MDDPDKCSWCGSKNIRPVIEWGDNDYAPFPVPYTKICVETKRKTMHKPVYDVSKLFKED